MPQGEFEIEDLPFNSVFNQKLIDSLPGIFYLYKIEGDSAKLVGWNRNHMIVSGYYEDECRDKPPIFFVDENSMPAINQAVQQLIATGEVRNVNGNIKTKSGEIIPHIFEGYKFEHGKNKYFMGVGIDCSGLVSLKEQMHLLELEKEHAIREKIKKESELMSIALREGNNDKLLFDTFRKLKNLLKEDNLQALHLQIKHHLEALSIQSRLKDNWDVFRVQFNNVHNQFFQRLRKEHPTLTSGELRYCAYIKVHMSPSQLTTLLNISKNGLKKKRYRIKKKLDLAADADLDFYISQF